MRVAFVLPGLHSVVRGAEVAFESIAHELAQYENCQVTLFGAGDARPDDPYTFIHVDKRDRKLFESWPQIPIFRNEYIYEEATFALNFLTLYRPRDFDITVTCSYPFLNWILRSKGGKHRPAHIFVTQNSDHPAITNKSEYKFFGCEGLVCTNPEYFERNDKQWNCKLITNGVNPQQFFPKEVDRAALGLPQDVPIVLMVSALIASKRIIEAIKAVAEMDQVHLVVCGDGPERDYLRNEADRLMPGRIHFQTVSFSQIPDIYRSADVFLHLSLDEPFGNVYLEALASGLPIVSHDREVTRWILEDKAILVDTCDTSEIVRGLYRALDRESKADFSSRLDVINRRFQWSEIGRSYFEFLDKTLQQYSGNCP